MEIYTIGFTKKTAAEFFGSLRQTGIRRLIDIRFNNSSQLAGFTKREDLPFFLREICQAQYVHEPLLAPTQKMLDAYKKRKGSWAEYESQFWWTWEWSNTVGTLRRQKTALSIKEPHAAFTASHLDTSGDCFSASRAPAWRRYSGLRCCLLDADAWLISMHGRHPWDVSYRPVPRFTR